MDTLSSNQEREVEEEDDINTDRWGVLDIVHFWNKILSTAVRPLDPYIDRKLSAGRLRRLFCMEGCYAAT